MSTETQPTAEADHEGSADAERFQLPRGDDLRRLREAADLTVEEVAAAVGVSPSTVRGWEDGRDPRVGNLRRLLTVLRDPPENIDADSDDDEDNVDIPPAEELPDPIDPEFLKRYGTASVEEAIHAAEHEPSTTPREAMNRCVSCLSVRYWPKSPNPSADQRNAIDTDYKCTTCREHFDEPAPPEREVDHAVDTVLRLSETGTCSVCADDAQLFAYDATTGYGGYVCFEHIGDLLARGDSA